MFRRFRLSCWTLGALALGAAAHADEPSRFAPPPATSVAISDNQAFANTIAQHLRQGGTLHQYLINVSVQNGIVTLHGHVANPTQRDEALRLVRNLPGVRQVVDQLAVRSAVTPVSANQSPLAEPGPLLKPPAAPMPLAPKAPVLQPSPMFQPAPGPQGQVQEPTPIFQAPPNHSPMAMQMPPLPPYAWPTYAPYNNFSRVAYPTQYTPNAWPFIGPNYPFPKVPPGWRSISLTYSDGHWWYGRHATGHDWWRIRYH